MLTTAESRANIWLQQNVLTPPVASAAYVLRWYCSFIVAICFSCCSHCLWGFCVWSLFCYAVLSVLSCFAEEELESGLIVAPVVCGVFCVWHLLCYAVLSVLSCFAIISGRKS